MNGASECPVGDDAGTFPDDGTDRDGAERGWISWLIPGHVPAARRLISVARELIVSPETWTKGTRARDVYGAPVSPGDDRAVSFCAVGALLRAARFETTGEHSVDLGAELILFHPLPLAIAALAVAGTMYGVSAIASGRSSTQAEDWALLRQRVFDHPEVIESRADGAAHLLAVLARSFEELSRLNDEPEITHQNVLRAFDLGLEALDDPTSSDTREELS